ncbi:VanZ family protein [Thalassobacillus sp. CUG 92003]|uniref:VanZ family protein n=1 Tax=Thalassobacillus sp. CUG 92003 TaxID=2736641 RepID=UPI0015E76D55|nr:VanZ family protein [Thalassobacillus sp. CUG 92003]
MNRAWVYWLLSAVVMGIIFYSSSQPYQEQDMRPMLSDTGVLDGLAPLFADVSFTYHHAEVSVEALGIAGFVEFFIRKAAHVTIFLLLTLSLYRAISLSFRMKRRYVMLAAWLTTVFYAIFDEWHQSLTPNRTPNGGDVLLDAVGGLIALGGIFLWLRYKKYSKI